MIQLIVHELFVIVGFVLFYSFNKQFTCYKRKNYKEVAKKIIQGFSRRVWHQPGGT